MAKTDRGFNKLKGVTISQVDALAVNEVLIRGTDGYLYAISGEAGPLGIPVLSLKRHKEVMYKLPRTGAQMLTADSKAPAWPYPPLEPADKAGTKIKRKKD